MRNIKWVMVAMLFIAFVTTFNYGGCGDSGSSGSSAPVSNLPAKVTYTYPTPNGVTNVPRNINSYVTLAWNVASGANDYMTYFGSNPPPAITGWNTNTTETTPTLSANTTYYWRVDSRNYYGVTQGDVWSFRTAP